LVEKNKKKEKKKKKKKKKKKRRKRNQPRFMNEEGASDSQESPASNQFLPHVQQSF
jgi:CelD/BcsL family acetyltransferase involved in cellulose biosynthesis